MFGLLNIDKPRGPTSRDVVNRVARLVKPHKAGHAGTLDPLATGVLVVAVGPATRLIEYVQRLPKTYLGTFQLGRTSDTEDIAGTVVALASPPIPTPDELFAVLPRFIGTIEQRPPAYSAVKVAGQRAYAMSRRGESVELATRPVVIHALEVHRYEYPELDLLIRCGSGTYVRSLGRDIAEALGTGAVMSALQRAAIGPFSNGEAIHYDALDAQTVHERLLPPHLALAGLPERVLTETEVARVSHGQPLDLGNTIAGEEVAALDGGGQLVAILEPRGDRLWPLRCFVNQMVSERREPPGR